MNYPPYIYLLCEQVFVFILRQLLDDVGRMAKLTKRRKSVLDFIEAYIKLHGVSPSYEAIALGIGLSAKANAHRIVKRLELDGFVTTSRRFYSIRIASLPPSDVSKVI